MKVEELIKNPMVITAAILLTIVIIYFATKKQSSPDHKVKETFVDTFSNSTDTFALKTITEKEKNIFLNPLQ
jgi:uncharacterized membrane protein YvbJ